MSTFTVEVVRLDDVLPHTNADALELAVIGGYRAVVQKGIHAPGDLVLYVPEDALIPQDIVDFWGFTGKLAGKDKNRVKAIRLRGELSQGLVIPLAKVEETLSTLRPLVPDEAVGAAQRVHGTAGDSVDYTGAEPKWILREGDNLAAQLHIDRWEEPIPAHMAGKARPRPSWFPVYTEIENIKKFNRALEPGEWVVFTEKIHGTNFGAGMLRSDRQMLVSSHRLVLERDEENLYWRAAIQFGLERYLNDILDSTAAESAVIYGEVFGPGVQDLHYGVLPNRLGFRIFDIMLDQRYVDWEVFAQLVGAEAEVGEADGKGLMAVEWTSDLPMVPVLYAGPYSEEMVARYTTGRDTLSDTHIREGIVIRPLRERYQGALGRVILKSVSGDYLTRKGGTERH